MSEPITYTQDELNALLNQARSDEKAKLYSEINFAKERASRLETEMAALKAQQDKLTNTAEQNAELQKKIDGLQTSLTAANADWETKLQKAVDTTLQTATQAFERQRQADRVADRKEALINAADGKIIPEMVVGNTIEEIEASAKAARDKFASIYEAGKTEAAKTALPPPVNPGSGGNPNPNNTEPTANLRSLSPQEWESQRNTIKDEVFAKLGLQRKKQ